MGDKDIIQREFMSDPEVFAELFNKNVFKADVIKPDMLQDADTVFTQVIGKEDGLDKPKGIKRERDLLKQAVIKTDGEAIYCCAYLGLENQSYSDNSMCTRVMEYDLYVYRKQEEDWIDKRRRERKARGQDLSNYSIDQDEEFSYIPVITLVLNLTGHDWTPHRTLHERMDLTPFKNGIKPFDYGYVVLNPAELSIEEIEEYQTAIRPALGILSKKENLRDVAEFMDKNKEFFTNTPKKFKNYYDILIDEYILEDIEKIDQKKKEELMLEQKLTYEQKVDWIIKGWADSRADGAKQAKREGTINLLLEGISPEIISKCLNLPLEEVLEIQKEL